jgi:hypothetical protein
MKMMMHIKAPCRTDGEPIRPPTPREIQTNVQTALVPSPCGLLDKDLAQHSSFENLEINSPRVCMAQGCKRHPSSIIHR